MCYITLIKAATVCITGIGVGMAFKNQITNLGKSAVNGLQNLCRKTQKAYHEGERSVNLGGDVREEDLPHESDETRRASVKTIRSDNDEQISRLKEKLAVVERENGVLKRECESMRLKLEVKIEEQFSKLIKRLHRISEQPEIKAILEEAGLSLYTDFHSFSDGFMRIKDESVKEECRGI